MTKRIYPRIQPLTAARAQELAANRDRDRLLDQIIHAESREEIEVAKQAQWEWLIQNPDDFGVLNAGECLAYAEEALDEKASERSQLREIPSA